MTGLQLETLAVNLLTTAEVMSCPCCGTVNARCRVWAGGPGHALGMHDARIMLAQEALIGHPTDLPDEPPAAETAKTTTLTPAIAKDHLELTRGSDQEVTAA